MDINDLRSLITVVGFLVFCRIVWWAWSGRRRNAFDEAARLPLEDDFPLQPAAVRIESYAKARKGNGS